MWGCSGRSRLEIAVREIGSPQRRLASLDDRLHEGRGILQIMPLRVKGWILGKHTVFAFDVKIPAA